ncbi:MAG: hypothetical protein JSU77_05490 [Fidelibacterota bacterium]|nr:MAG: hypothetical protein JSU77_05490 [Candidatus Neomarinimicrobiota bacterium]
MHGFHYTSRSLMGLILAGIVLFHVSPLPAQNIPMAVIELEGVGISRAVATTLTDRLRSELLRLGTFDVIARGKMENTLAGHYFRQTGCITDECLIRAGGLVGAWLVAGGRISRKGTVYTVSARLIDVETGQVLGVSHFELQGGIDDLLNFGMKRAALLLSGDQEGARQLAEQQIYQPATPATRTGSTSARQRQLAVSARPADTKPRRWQSRIGAWESEYDFCFSLPFSYNLEGDLNLGSTRLQRVVSGGYLYRSYYEGEYEDYRESEGLLYGMLEFHKNWSSSTGNSGVSAYLGIGCGSGFYESYDEEYYYVDGDGYDEIVSFLFTVGAQARARLLPVLPTLVGDISLVVTPNYGASTVLTVGGQGSFVQLASVWGFIFFMILSAEGGF